MLQHHQRKSRRKKKRNRQRKRKRAKIEKTLNKTITIGMSHVRTDGTYFGWELWVKYIEIYL